MKMAEEMKRRNLEESYGQNFLNEAHLAENQQSHARHKLLPTEETVGHRKAAEMVADLKNSYTQGFQSQPYDLNQNQYLGAKTG